ncbi:regulatory protein cys-3 [Apiospora phragmitis]|uniref:Regulatory protein cys-3 n=1 Tax=Apiospora phragmitis TaxID=2905665 RepID=A0ABR1WU61_9PEZI
MSLYHGGNGGRRNLNFSQYLNNLNEVSTQEASPEEPFVDDDLSMFAGEFIDWSHTAQPELHAPVEAEVSAQNTDAAAATAAPAANLALDFTSPVADEFDFNFAHYPNAPVSSFTEGLNLQPLQPNSQPVYPPAATQQSPYGIPSEATNKPAPSHPGRSRARQMSLEEQSRVAAEEDKRRRNTAASARFRVKKKAREQALEKREKELGDEVSELKKRITHLETENKWLKNLVMGKLDSKDGTDNTKLRAALEEVGKGSDTEENVEKESKAAEVEASS